MLSSLVLSSLPSVRPSAPPPPLPRHTRLVLLHRTTLTWTPDYRKHGLPQQWSRTRRSHSLQVINMTGEHWDDGRSHVFDRASVSLRKLFERTPEPVQQFPWGRVAGHFFRTVLELTIAVTKYLSVPLLAISSLSEMSYSAHERKMVVIPVPFIAGIAVASVLNNTAMELSSHLKEGEFPCHLLVTAIFFLLLKLPGPYYPYLGRLVVPHFANGGLWTTIWFAFQWYRRASVASESELISVSQNRSDE